MIDYNIVGQIQTPRNAGLVGLNQALEMGQKIRELEDEKAVNKALATFADPEQAAQQLTLSGRGTAALKLREITDKQRDAYHRSLVAGLVLKKTQVDMGVSLINGITDEASFATLMPEVAKLSPEVANTIGPQWDPVETPKKLEQARYIGKSADEMLRTQAAALTKLGAAIKLGEDASGAIAEALAGAEGPQMAQSALAVLKGYHLPKDQEDALIKKFDWSGTPEARARARNYALTVKQQEDLAMQQSRADEAVARREQAADLADARLEIQRQGVDLQAQRLQDLRDRAGAGGGAAAKPVTGVQKATAIDRKKRELAAFTAGWKWNPKTRVYDNRDAKIGATLDTRKALTDDEYRDELLEIENQYRRRMKMDDAETLEEAGWNMKPTSAPDAAAPTPSVAPPQAKKTMTRAELVEVARQNNATVAEAERQMRARGYDIR